MRRLISPVDFSSLIRTAQALRAGPEGMSQTQAVREACHQSGISDEWAMPLAGFINDSPSLSESWAEVVLNNALDRAAARCRAELG